MPRLKTESIERVQEIRSDAGGALGLAEAAGGNDMGGAWRSTPRSAAKSNLGGRSGSMAVPRGGASPGTAPWHTVKQ